MTEEISTLQQSEVINAEQRHFRMTLAHPTAMLHLQKVHDHPIQYQGYFEHLDQLGILRIAAHGLSREGRFANMTRKHVSVLDHSLWLHEWFHHKRQNRNAAWAVLHDVAEAFLHDFPKLMKTDDHRARESAVMRAMELPWIDFDEEEFKKMDGIAAAAEARLFGYNWSWIIDRYVKAYGQELVDEYTDWIQNKVSLCEDREHRWIYLAQMYIGHFRNYNRRMVGTFVAWVEDEDGKGWAPLGRLSNGTLVYPAGYGKPCRLRETAVEDAKYVKCEVNEMGFSVTFDGFRLME